MAPALAAHRATDVLRYIARHHEQTLTLSLLARELDISPAAMHAVLNALTSSGLLERDEATKTYRLGPEAAVIGSAARAQDRALISAAAAAARIVERHHLSVAVLALRGHEMLVIDGFGPQVSWNSLAVPGRSVPFAAPFGTVFAAQAPPQEIVAWLQRGGIDPATRTAQRLRDELVLVAERGWSVGIAPGSGSAPETWMPAYIDRIARGRTDANHIDAARYVLDDVESPGTVRPTLISVGLEQSQHGVPMALTVCGFDRPLSRRAVAELAETVTAAALGRTVSGIAAPDPAVPKAEAAHIIGRHVDN